MPKELHIVPNERIDLSDFRYGTRTFTVDSLKDHVHRLFTGDYSGGFVLEGFRVEVNDSANRKITVHNGIAIDREGRLITYEDGDNFKNNSDASSPSIQLPSTNTDYYVFVEFALADAPTEPRAIWDPTFDNGNISDSGENTHDADKGKEFTVNIPTRKAHSYKINFQTGSFPDSTDAGTLKIPVAVVTVAATAISVTTEKAQTTVMKAPRATAGSTAVTKLQCADTRHFPTTGSLQVINQESGLAREFSGGSTAVTYNSNDRYNNVLGEMSFIELAETATFEYEVKIGDFIRCTTGPNYVVAGSKYDARPMLFSFTDPTAASQEASDNVNFGNELRNLRYFSGRALVNDPSGSQPDSTSFSNRDVDKLNSRVENNIKQAQDFFRVLGTLIREMKFGQPFTMRGTTEGITTTDDSLLTHQGKGQIVDTSEFFDKSFVGATFTVTHSGHPNADASRTISDVIGNHILKFSSDFTADIETAKAYKITKSIASDTKYVDHREVGNLNEVFRARVDRFNNTYTNDLQTRLQANKGFIATIGDGIHSVGDYNVKSSDDLAAVINKITVDNALNKVGGTIYIKQGIYSMKSVAYVRENMHITGDGPEATTISMADPGDHFRIQGTAVKTTGSTNRHSIDGVKFSNLYLLGAVETDGNANDSGRDTVITSTDDALSNFTLDNMRIRAGSHYDKDAGGNAGKVLSSAIVIGGADVDTANKNIKILNSKFEVTGRGINFQSNSRNVKIDNCVFVSEEVDTSELGDEFDFAGMVEGITFNRPSNDDFKYGKNNSKAAGSISITNCDFSGKQTSITDLGGKPQRGWIFFNSDFQGPAINISNCNFVGDALGTVTEDTYPDVAASIDGRCITNNADITLNISNCNFNSYDVGISSSAGSVNVNGCHFEDMAGSIRLTNGIDYSDVAAGKINSQANLFVEGCSFKDHTDHGTGITIGSLADKNDPDNICVIKNSVFNKLLVGIDATELSDATTSLADMNSQQYGLIEVSGCTFSKVETYCFKTDPNGFSRSGGGSNEHNLSSGFGVDNFVYQGNKHKDCSTNTADHVVRVSGKSVVAKDNTFTGGISTLDRVLLHVAGGARYTNITGNQFHDFEGVTVNKSTTAIQVDIPARPSGSPTQEQVSLSINNNIIHTSDKSAASDGINNGILINRYTAGHSTPIQVHGTVSGNDICLTNMNFGILARQDFYDDGTVDENVTKYANWEWGELLCQNNKVQSRYPGSAGIFFPAQGNDTNVTWTKPDASTEKFWMTAGRLNGGVLNDAAMSSALAQYVGYIDLRFCNPFANVSIINNKVGSIQVDDAPDAAVFDSSIKDINTVVGIRILRLPARLTVSNNIIQDATLVLKSTWGRAGLGTSAGDTEENYWTAGLGRFLSTENLRTKAIVTDNHVKCRFQGCVVDIGPATGESHSGIATGETTIASTLSFMRNTIVGGPLSTADYASNSGVVRIWPKQGYDAGSTTTFTNASTQPAQSGWNATGLLFDIKLCDNILHDTLFYIDPSDTGASTSLFDGDGGTPPNSGCILISGNTKIVKSTSVNQHDDICGFSVTHGRDWFGDLASTVEKAVPGAPNDPNCPFVVVENTIIVVNDKSKTLRIVRGTQSAGTIQTVTGLEA